MKERKKSMVRRLNFLVCKQFERLSFSFATDMSLNLNRKLLHINSIASLKINNKIVFLISNFIQNCWNLRTSLNWMRWTLYQCTLKLTMLIFSGYFDFPLGKSIKSIKRTFVFKERFTSFWRPGSKVLMKKQPSENFAQFYGRTGMKSVLSSSETTMHANRIKVDLWLVAFVNATDYQIIRTVNSVEYCHNALFTNDSHIQLFHWMINDIYFLRAFLG